MAVVKIPTKKEVEQFAPLKEVCMLANILKQYFSIASTGGYLRDPVSQFFFAEFERRLEPFSVETFDRSFSKFSKIWDLYNEISLFNLSISKKTEKEGIALLEKAHDIIDKIYWQHWQNMGLELPEEVKARME